MVRQLTDDVALLSVHVDALELSCNVTQVPMLYDGETDRLGTLLAELTTVARSAAPARPVQSNWTWESTRGPTPVTVLPRSLRRSYAFALECCDWLLVVASPRAVVPRVMVQLRSEYLLTEGAHTAYERIRAWVERHLLPLIEGRPVGDSPVWSIARLDLAADLVGVQLHIADLARFTARARTRQSWHVGDGAGRRETGMNGDATTHHTGRRLTGLTFGKRGRDLYCRIYDKTAESASDALIRQVWGRAGYKSAAENAAPVWRVEFEVRAAFLRSLIADGRHVTCDPAAILGHEIDRLWPLLLNDWLVLRDARNETTRIERRPIEPWWAELADCRFHVADNPSRAHRLERRPPRAQDPVRLLRQARGLLVSVAALNGNPSRTDALDGFTRFVTETCGEQSFAAAVAERMTAQKPLRPLAA